jgi:fructokinase
MLDLGVSLAVVTLGENGAYAAQRDARVRSNAPPVEVVDTIGAGDAFGAALLAWLHDHVAIRPELRLERAELQAALDFACLAGALTCTRAGADPPRKWELEARNPRR